MADSMKANSLLGTLTPQALRSSGSMKWNLLPQSINGHTTLPCFVAEMDFAPAQPIREAVSQWALKGPLGYTPPAILEQFQQAIAQFYADAGLSIAANDVRPVSDLVTLFDVVVDAFIPNNAPVTLLTPTYMNFVGHPYGERPVNHVDLVLENNQWELDWEQLEQALADGGLLVLVNPHNPLGKVYSREELTRVAQLAHKYQVRVFADEIHSPISFGNAEHIPFASVSSEAAEVALTAFAVTKAYSIPGAKAACLILTNPEDQQVWDVHGQLHEYGTPTSGLVATIAALEESSVWFNAAMEYLAANRQWVIDAVAQQLPGASMIAPEATYLAWVDLRGTKNFTELARGLDAERSLAGIIAQRCGVFATDGAECGTAGEGSIRINFATGQTVLKEIFNRLSTLLCN